jgi:hypothetical protein
MNTWRDRLERGHGMRAQRIVEGLLLSATFFFDDLRPAYVAIALMAPQMLTPFAAPVALLWAASDRRPVPDRLGNLYFDQNGSRGAAIISCTLLAIVLVLIRWSTVPLLGRILIAAPAASCILSGTVGFCAGCSFYVIGRDLMVRAGLLREIQGACDVEFDG